MLKEFFMEYQPETVGQMREVIASPKMVQGYKELEKYVADKTRLGLVWPSSLRQLVFPYLKQRTGIFALLYCTHLNTQEKYLGPGLQQIMRHYDFAGGYRAYPTIPGPSGQSPITVLYKIWPFKFSEMVALGVVARPRVVSDRGEPEELW